MMHIKAVNKVYPEAAIPQVSRKVQETKRFRPEVIGCKIIDPWIDEDKLWSQWLII